MDIRLYDIKQKMKKAVEIVSTDIGSVRTSRPAPSLVENIIINAYGGLQKLRVMELGTIAVQDAKTLIIQPWDSSVLSEIQKGIMEANIGLTPTIDGNLIRISFPPLTEERRDEFVKLLKQKIEAGKVMVRQVRHEKMGDIKRSFEQKQLTEDDRRKLEEDLQKLTDEHIVQIDEIGKKKEEELTQI